MPRLPSAICAKWAAPRVRKGTNCGGGERIYPWQAPIAEGEREYTRGRHQLRKGRENIPVAGTNRRRGGRIYL
eukprot:1676131-Pyramimonas_sp.AAC.1